MNNATAYSPTIVQERATRCQQALTAYSRADTETNLVDFLADAMHWCHLNGHSFDDALDTAVMDSFHDALDTAAMHFDAETTGDDILDDLNRQPSTERSQP
jgi:hypothetical protein